MKKRIIALTLAFGLVFSIVGQGSVYADEAAAEGTTIETAVVRELNAEYSVTWQDGVDESYNIIKLEKSGILDISFTKATSNTLGVHDAIVEIYDEKGNAFYYVKDENDNVTNAHLYVGLKAGTYYVKLAPYYSSYAYNSTSAFQFTFTESTKLEF